MKTLLSQRIDLYEPSFDTSFFDLLKYFLEAHETLVQLC